MNHTKTRKPVVLMPMGAQVKAGHEYQVMTLKYMRPLVEIAKCVPLLAPTSFGNDDHEQYLSMVDGVYLTGAGSNIDPAHYGQENLTPEKGMDPDRDAFDIPLIHAALKMGLPFFGVCRGMQELNVALGGDIHQKVYAVDGFNDHREDSDAPVADQYSHDAHKVRIIPHTWLAQLLGTTEIGVNSLHGQAIKNLGKGLEPLAMAEDGLIEAVHLPDQPQFTLGVQWHPEWKASENPHSVQMYQAFGDACRKYAAQRSN